MRKRITSLLLVLALCLTLLPTAALAEASSLAAQEAGGGTENGEDYTVGEDTAVRARTRAAATGEVYRISNADDLEAFCKRVNGGESSLNAVLLNDVSRNKNYSWTSIKGYTGVFDGNGHTITLRVGGSGENNALFGSIAKGGIVQDLTIQIYNWSVNISTATGSIAYSNNGTIQRCQALDWTGEKNIGGIVYHNESEGVVKDCRVGTLTLSKSRENLVGGIAFINDGLLQDCYVSGRLQSTSSGPRGDLSSATAIVRTNSGTVENCYYLQYDGETAVAGTPVTDEAAFASGEVAYKLNGKKTETDSVWRQNLPGNKDGADADGLPVTDASHGRVYYDSESGSYYSLLAHVHDGEELTAWQQTDSLPDASGMYYLTGNVTLTSGQALGNDVTLCVNGHSVTGDVTVTGGSFTLADCGDGSFTGDVTVNEGGSFTLEDCALSGKIENSGTLTVTGGTVTAADGIGVENKGTFTMNSGTITAAGTGVVNTGTLTMNGGAVTGCGKGVENSGTMDVSGDVRIAGNTNGNLLLPEGITVTVGTLDSTANIGVTAEKQSELTAGGSIRLTSGGAAYTTRFFADDAAAYAIFADGEDLVMRTLGEHTHCICGHPADGAADIGDHTTHADVTFQPWTSGNSLPTEGNYYLTQNVVLSKTTVLTGTLCLNGYSISVKDGGGPVEVSSGTLNLTDCAAQPGSVTAARDQAINVYNSGSANIFNGVIRSSSGTGIYIGPYAANANVAIYGGKITGSGTGAAANNGTMHMYGGEISGNSRGVQAGGTKGSGSFNGSFYLHGGKITDNHGSEGGGVYVMNYFSMDGGEVSYNSATGSGGGIYVFTGTASLSGGKVTGNRAGENGGGVCTKAFRDARSYVNLSGSAEISNNYAGGRGGGVYLDVYNYLGNGNYCQLTMDGGKITGNTSVGDGGGVYADAADGNYQFRSTVNVKGGAQITGNKKGEADNNLYLPRYSEGVTIRGDLDDTADIRVTTEIKPSEGSEVTIAKKSGWVSGTVTVPDGAFKVDGADGTIRIGEDGSTVKLVPHTHVWTYALKSGTTDTVIAVCSGCSASGGSVTIKAPAELTYSGGDKEATLDDQLTTGVTVSASDIGYRMGASLTGELPAGSYPRNAGTYTASITLGEGTGAVTASVTYTIGKKDLTITANGNTITYGDTAFDRGVTYNGFVDGQDAGVLGGSLTYIFSYIPGSDTGLYIIAPQGVTSDNYEITFVPGTLTVGQREVTLTWHDYENRTYGDGKTVTATAGNLLEADAGKVQVTVRDGGWNEAGSWVACADGLTGDKAGNYKLPTTNLTQNYFIALAGQTLTFERSGDQTVVYGRTLTNPATNDRAGQGGSDVTYTSSDETIATVDESGTVTARKVGTVTITAAAAAMNGKYSNATAAYTLTVEPKTLTRDDLTYTGSITKVYDGSDSAPNGLAVFVKPASLVGSDTLAVTGTLQFNSANANEADTITFTPEAITAGNYRLAATEVLTVTNGAAITPRVLTVGTVTTTPKQFDGNSNATFYVTNIELIGIVAGETLTMDATGAPGDYGIYDTRFDSANTGARTITGTVALLSRVKNYSFANGATTAPFTADGEIVQADARDLGTVQLEQRYTDTAEKEYQPDYEKLMPDNAGKLTYDVSYEVTKGTATVGRNDKEEATGKLTYQISGQVGAEITWTFTVRSDNYKDSTFRLVVTVIDREEQTGFKFENNTTALTRSYGDPDFTVAAVGAAAGSTVTYRSSDPDVAAVDENGTVHILKIGTATITAKASDTQDYTEKEIPYTLTVDPKTLTKDDLTYTGSITKVYDGSDSAPNGLAVFVKPASLVGSDTLAVTGTLQFNSANVSEADTITFTPEAITAGNYRLAATEVLTITGADITQATPVYTVPSDLQAAYGQTLADVTLPDGWSWMDGTLSVGDVSAVPDTFKARFTPADTGNYAVVPNIDVPVAVYKADGGSLAEVPLTQKYTDTGDHTYTPDWGGLPTGQSWTFSSEASTVLSKQDFAADGSRLTYAIAGGSVGDVITVTLKASCGNYEDFTITLRITLTEKDNQAALRVTGGTTVVYGETLQLGTSGGSGAGAVTYAVTDGTGKATIDANGVLTPVQVGSVTVTATKAGDDAYNDVTSAAVTVTVTKAMPTGVPGYTPVTGRGKTLRDAALTIEGGSLSLKDGTLEWVDKDGNVLPDDTVIEAGKSYKWRFTPADGNYTAISGETVLYSPAEDDTGHGNSHNYRIIRVTVRGNGSVSPSGWADVPIGGDQTFTITPDKGYAVAKVLIDGQSVGAVTSYTFRGVTEGHTIEVIFMKANGNPQTGVDARKFS